MGVLSACVFVFLIYGAISTDDDLLHPCSKNDIRCLSESARDFLERTSAGIKQFDIRPIDPWKVAMIMIPMESGLTMFLRNVSVTGLKNLKINDFKIDTTNKSVVLEMKDNAEIEADIEVIKGDNRMSGSFFGKGIKLMTAKYTYDLVPNDKGEEYFRVGPEALNCRLENKPQITMQDDIAKELWSNQDNVEEAQRRLMCSIIEPAYNDVMYNLRSSAKFYPKTSYFTDL